MEKGGGGSRSSSRRLAHVPALDGLRGVAVAAVVWFHAGHLTGGYLGVDLFFVLSGYLITSLLVLEWADTGRIALGAFWGRRARRLLPALLAMLAVVGLLARSEVLPTVLDDLRSAGMATLAYVANWWAIATGNGYWDQALAPSWLEHTWSLAIEEQFYVLWPLVVVAVLGWRQLRDPRAGHADDGRAGPRVRRRAVGRLGMVAGVAALASASLMVVGAVAGWSSERLYLGTDTRVAAILAGAWVACRQHGDVERRELHERTRWALAAASVVAMLGLAWAYTGLDGADPFLYRGGLAICGLAAALVIADVTTPGPSLSARVLAVPVLMWLGTISYGLYLWHWPVFRFFYGGRYGLTGWSLTAVRVGVALLVAAASYYLIERPVLHGFGRGLLGPALPWGFAAVVLALVLGTSGAVPVSVPTAPAGLASPAGTPTPTGPLGTAPPTPPTTPTEPLAEPPPGPVSIRSPWATDAAAAPKRSADAAADHRGSDPTRSGDGALDGGRVGDGSGTVMVVGDSVAVSLAVDGLGPEAAGTPVVVSNRGEIGCSLMIDHRQGDDGLTHDCSVRWPDAVRADRPDVVLVLFGGYVGASEVVVGDDLVNACHPAYRRAWRERLHESADVFAADGATVVLATAPGPADPRFKGDDPSGFDERQACSNEVIRDVVRERDDAELLELAGWVCPDGECRADVDGVRLRRDVVHFQDEGARVVARWVLPRLRAVLAG